MKRLWRELSKKLSVTVNIQELNDNGDYNNVKVAEEHDGTGGTFQLRQGQQRRVVVMVKPISRSGGVTYLGQDQDSLGGGFNPRQSWSGEIT